MSKLIMTMLAIAAALVIGCTIPATSAKGSTVNATLTEMKIAVDRTSTSAGPVTFVVKNSGAVVHELVVLQTDVAQASESDMEDPPGSNSTSSKS